MTFSYFNVKFQKHSFEEAIVATGEIKNDSSRDYNSILFRIILYNKDLIVGTGVLRIQDFRKGSLKAFYAVIEAHHSIINSVTRFEIVFEGGH